MTLETIDFIPIPKLNKNEQNKQNKCDENVNWKFNAIINNNNFLPKNHKYTRNISFEVTQFLFRIKVLKLQRIRKNHIKICIDSLISSTIMDSFRKFIGRNGVLVPTGSAENSTIRPSLLIPVEYKSKTYPTIHLKTLFLGMKSHQQSALLTLTLSQVTYKVLTK